MRSIIFSLVFVLLTNFLIEPTTCVLPTYLQNLEFDDITSLQHELPSIISKISVIVSQFHCPTGWTHFGGSCYYLSKITSISTEANHTCNLLHSNYSNLMQIRNAVELFYAVHVLTKNNLSALMINIDPNLFKEKRIAENLIDYQERVKYYKLRKKILDELNSAGLRISRRSKNYKQKFIHNNINSNNRTVIDEYDNLNSENETDEFERIENIQGICDRIDWNVINNDSTIYKLTTDLISDKIICSFSNVKSDIEYRHVCEYVLNFCFANINCGKHGRCINTLSGFKCSCSFLFDGLRCERISKQGKQIRIAVILVLVLYGLSIKQIRWLLIATVKVCIIYCKRSRNRKHKKKNNENKIEDGTRKSVHRQETTEFILPRNAGPIKNPNKRNLIRLFWVGGLSILFLTLLLSIITITHFISFKYDTVNETRLESLLIDTTQLVAKCESIANYRTENLIFVPIALALVFIFSWSIKREEQCLHLCDGRPGLIAPFEPFHITNRFTTATVFGILAFEVLKTLEEPLFSTSDLLNRGILIILLERIALVLLIGLRYYPVLTSLQLRNITARFFICLYILADITYTILREGSCMGFLPLSKYYSALEEAKLRMELGTWFIIYGLIKHTPHFILLSYIAAELCVRFAYDTIYVSIKKKQSIWSAPVVQSDESAFAKYYVAKLFRRNVCSNRRIYSEYEANQSCIKKIFNSIYQWDDDFRFTTLAICTYTVAIIFLYYLACTLVFLYISSVRYYIDTIFNIEFKGFFSLKSIIIISAIITIVISVFHLFYGINNYKKHKLQLFKGIYEDISSATNFTSNTIASNSIRYFGFLVGHMTCGFLVLFHLIFFFLIAIRIISSSIHYNELVFTIIIPVLVVYSLITVGISTAARFLFIQNINRKIYAIFVYFTFFADCFLGIISCFIRLIKSTFLNIIYMSRLDCCLNGRSLEKMDSGFTAYVSYIHMEVTHTNPIMLAFCHLIFDDIVQRRTKHCHDDECCTAPGELNDDELSVELKPMVIENTPSKTTNCNVNDSSSKKTKLPARETASSVTNKSNSIDTDDDIQEEDEEVEARAFKKIKRQKQARFRWFLAYTILNNYRLFDLRKQVQSRLARLCTERSNLIDGQCTAASASQQYYIEMEIPESPDVDDYDQSPAEQERTRR